VLEVGINDGMFQKGSQMGKQQGGGSGSQMVPGSLLTHWGKVWSW